MPADASLTAPVVAQWGGYGVILIVLFLALAWTVQQLIGSQRDRMSDLKVMLEAKYKDSAEAAQNMRELKNAIDAIVNVVKARL